MKPCLERREVTTKVTEGMSMSSTIQHLDFKLSSVTHRAQTGVICFAAFAHNVWAGNSWHISKKYHTCGSYWETQVMFDVFTSEQLAVPALGAFPACVLEFWQVGELYGFCFSDCFSPFFCLSLPPSHPSYLSPFLSPSPPSLSPSLPVIPEFKQVNNFFKRAWQIH